MPVQQPGQQQQQQQQRAPAPAARGRPALRQQQQPAPQQASLQRREETSITFSRSQLMSLPVITRTSGKQLGYVSQLYVDSTSLAVASLYLRQEALPLPAPVAAAASQSGERLSVLLSSLRQIGDVILVHDERALSDGPMAEAQLCYKLVGAEVATWDGKQLGRVRDFTFDPDTGALSTIIYDLLGMPMLPQALLSAYQVDAAWIHSIGEARVVLKSGAEKAHKKLNDGAVNLGVQWLIQIVADNDDRVAAAGGTGGVALDRETMVRSDPGYIEWYRLYGKAYEATYGTIVPIPQQQLEKEAQRQGRQQPRGRAAQPRALPPPSSTSYSAALQPQQPRQQRQAVPAGGAAQAPPVQQRAMPQQAWGSGSGGMLLDVQRRPAAPPPRQRQQQQVAPGPAPPVPRPAAPAPPPQQQVPPVQQRQQQVVPPPGRSFNQAVRREVVQPDAIISNY